MNGPLAEVVASHVDALRPILHLRTQDCRHIVELVTQLRDGRPVHEYNFGEGVVDPVRRIPLFQVPLEAFLRQVLDERRALVILRDVHESLSDATIVGLLKSISERTLNDQDFHVTVFLVSPELEIPAALESFVTVIDVPRPRWEEIERIVGDFASSQRIAIESSVARPLARALTGLNELEIRQALALAFQRSGSLGTDGTARDRDFKLALQDVLAQKEQVIRKSGRLELVQVRESINQIGGLENMKRWLRRKAEVIHRLSEALDFKVDQPKGILIVGMPGCGKSLTAKATAHLFGLPLLRLDVGAMLGKFVGESEANMRQSLAVAEAASPCVLWIDELEKAFAGVGESDGGSSVTTRLLGQFLTWMQERESTVFVVATANDISRLPTEFLRKGRFDELFAVDLPNAEERVKILEIHLRQREKWHGDLNLIDLIDKTEGMNGADLEAVVKDAVETVFLSERASRSVSQQDLLESIARTHPFAETMKERVEEIRKRIGELRFIPAST